MNIIEKEKLLLEGLANEEKDAIEQIYKDNYQMIFHMVIKNNGTADDAADLFQEAMMVLFEKVKAGSFELNCQLKTFIYSVCKRLWLKKLQKMQRYQLSVDGVEETVAVEDELEHHEKQNADFSLMEATMAKIGEPCKSLLEAYYIHKKPMQEIAEHFGYTNADNAKTQKYKCLVRLKKLFFAQYKNGE